MVICCLMILVWCMRRYGFINGPSQRDIHQDYLHKFKTESKKEALRQAGYDLEEDSYHPGYRGPPQQTDHGGPTFGLHPQRHELVLHLDSQLQMHQPEENEREEAESIRRRRQEHVNQLSLIHI